MTTTVNGANTSTNVQDAFRIPLVDFSRYLHGSQREQDECVKEVMDGFTTSGFIYLQNSGLDPADAFKWSQKYFALPLEEKQKFPNEDKRANRGYSALGAEKATNADLTKEESIEELRKIFPDIKESLELGSDPAYGYPEKPFVNRLPEDQLPGFKEGMMEFYVKCDQLQKSVMSAIARGLGLESSYFEKQISEGYHVLRLLHYPAVPRSVLNGKGAVRIGPHTDYGTVTLLFQDGVGGLQARTPNGEYVHVPPVPGAIVINAADLLQIWTNETVKSTFHRVVAPPDMLVEGDNFAPRYSIAFFSHPDHNKLVTPIEECCTPSQPRKHEPLMPVDWMVKRLQATY